MKVIKNLSLKQCVKEKTRGDNILDLVFVYDKDFVYKLDYLPPIEISDHVTLKITLNVMICTVKVSVRLITIKLIINY